MKLVWFRQDLRLEDNPALTYVLEQERCVLVYIYDKNTHHIGEASKWWLYYSLRSLEHELNLKGHQLYLFKGDPLPILQKTIKILKINEIAWNRCYEPSVIARDTHIKSNLRNLGVRVQSFNGSLLFDPPKIKNKQDSFFKVFTPFGKHCLKTRVDSALPSIAKNKNPTVKNMSLCSLEINELGLLPKLPWGEKLRKYWTPGEESAKARLSVFIDNNLRGYKKNRDFLSLSVTSLLSPSLHFGEISPRYIWEKVSDYLLLSEGKYLDDVNCFLSELGWREFSYHILFYVKNIEKEPFRLKFRGFPWKEDLQNFEAWKKGETGIPVVDAGMRQLWETGYMHNRVRMIVASFLTKNLLISWKKGEEWFLDTLVDADLASNLLGWQWVSGVGVDAAPYFRIFNPVLQGEKFDASGDYIRRWVPELAKLDAKYIHNPWKSPQDRLLKAGIALGENYPFPIVDLKASRHNALLAYCQLKDSD